MFEQKVPTKQRLADALRSAGAPAGLVRDALAGAFDDYESPSATPLGDLVALCHAYGLPGVAERVRAGETPEMRALLARMAEVTRGR